MNARIQDAYPLAPGQEGILFHSLGAPGRGDYVIQIVLDGRGTPDPERERASWRALVARHDVLRTAFAWQGRSQPLQVVGRAAAMTPSVVDLSHLDAADQARHVGGWLAEDRTRGFELSRAPLLRVTRFRLGMARHRIVVTIHHAVLDGWSIPIILRDWLALHEGADLPPSRPFRDHIARLHAQDGAAARAFWSAELDGRPDGRLDLEAPRTRSPSARGDTDLTLSARETDNLVGMAKGRGLTLATAVHGAWALMQARATGSDEAIYGLARSGRAPGLDGAGDRVGMFLNTLPMRVRLDGDRGLADWLRDLQERRHAQAPHEHIPLAELHRLVGRRDGAAIFDTAVVFENYPTDPARLAAMRDFAIESVEVLEQTNLPLTLFATPEPTLRLRLLFDAGRIDGTAAAGVLADLRQILTVLATAPDTPLREIATLTRAASATETEPAAAPQAHDDLVPPLARIWAEILGSAPPEPDDNFFELGGHSLLVLALRDGIRRDLDLEVEIPDLFRFATLGAQSGHLARLRDPGATAEAPQARAEARLAGRDRLRRRAHTQSKDSKADA